MSIDSQDRRTFEQMFPVLRQLRGKVLNHVEIKDVDRTILDVKVPVGKKNAKEGYVLLVNGDSTLAYSLGRTKYKFPHVGDDTDRWQKVRSIFGMVTFAVVVIVSVAIAVGLAGFSRETVGCPIVGGVVGFLIFFGFLNDAGKSRRNKLTDRECNETVAQALPHVTFSVCSIVVYDETQLEENEATNIVTIYKVPQGHTLDTWLDANGESVKKKIMEDLEKVNEAAKDKPAPIPASLIIDGYCSRCNTKVPTGKAVPKFCGQCGAQLIWPVIDNGPGAGVICG